MDVKFLCSGTTDHPHSRRQMRGKMEWKGSFNSIGIMRCPQKTCTNIVRVRIEFFPDEEKKALIKSTQDKVLRNLRVSASTQNANAKKES